MKKYINLTVLASIVMSLTFIACSSEDEQPTGTPFVPTPVELGVGLRTTAGTRADTWGASGVGTATWATSANSIGNFFAANDLVALISIDDTNVDLSTTGDSARIKGLEYKVSTASTGAQAQTGLTASSTKFYWTSSNETKRIIAWSVGRSASYTAGTDGITVSPNMSTPGTVPESVEIVSDQSDDATNVDFLWGFLSLGYDKKATNNDIPMYHQLALLTVNITTTNALAAPTACYFGKNLTSNGGGKLLMQGTFIPPIIISSANDSIATVANTAFSVTSYAKTAQKSWAVSASPTFADYTGKWINQVKKGYIKPRRTAYDGTAKTASYSAVVLPYNYTSSSVTLFEITVDGITYKYIPTTATNLEPGKHYTYTVTVGPTGLDVTASIKDWNPVSGGTQSAVLD